MADDYYKSLSITFQSKIVIESIDNSRNCNCAALRRFSGNKSPRIGRRHIRIHHLQIVQPCAIYKISYS